jgi:hypothetical protein
MVRFEACSSERHEAVLYRLETLQTKLFKRVYA